MARKNLNPAYRYIAVLTRKSNKAIEATGWFDNRATGSFSNSITIPIDALNSATTNKIIAGNTYVGIVEHQVDMGVYSISQIYSYAPDELVYLMVKDMSKFEEVETFTKELNAFYNRSNLNFNIDGAVNLGEHAIKEERPLVFGSAIRFKHVDKVVTSLKVSISQYSISIVSKNEVENGVINPLFILEDIAENWNSVYSPEPIADIEFDTYVMPKSLSLAVSTILPKAMNQGRNTVLGFIGDSGNGKTAAAQHIATYLSQRLNRPIKFTKINVPAIQRPSDFFLTREFRNGETVDEYTNFYNLLTGGDAVILLDEANRVPADILNVVLGVTDGSQYFFLRGTDHEIGKNITFILAFNTGYEYTGTFDMDKAMLSRMNLRIDFSLPSKDELSKILSLNYPNAPAEITNALILLCHELDKLKKSNQVTVDVSVRALLNWCFILDKFDYRNIMIMDALQLCIVNFAQDNDEKTLLNTTIKVVLETNGVL